ncbi:redoxin domain-containing protein [Aurantivibrio plasticivorans]
MRKASRFLFALLVTLPALIMSGFLQAAQTLEKVSDFSLIDHNGKILELSRQRFNKALVIFAHGDQCDSSSADLAALRRVRDNWQERAVNVVMMNSIANESREDIIKAVERSDIEFRVLDDSSQLVAEALGLTQAGQVVVVDPSTKAIHYRGPLGATVERTLEDLLAGKSKATVNINTTSGCDIAFRAKQMHEQKVPDYSTVIAPLVEKNCAYCHREGGIGPFAMNSHIMLKGFAPMIKEVLLTKRMPPMQVDPHVNSFTNANYMSDQELQTFVHWIDAGAPRGKGKVDPLTAIAHGDLRAWQLGEPDHIVVAPEHDIPATGVLDYYNEVVELSFDEDKWVKAVQFIPGDPAVLHHLLTYVVAPSEEFQPGRRVAQGVDIGEAAAVPQPGRNVASGLNSRKFLEGYAPGKVDAMVFPENTGVFVPKGHNLAMQFHYTTNGKATKDKTILGIYFHDEKTLPVDEYLNLAVATPFKIPANAIEHNVVAKHTFAEPITLYGLRAHMHFRGRDMKFSLEYPEGELVDVLNVADYSYAWQPTYQLEKPMYIPAGATMYVTGSFDNSQYNPANPDPNKEVTFGLQSWDEMYIGYLSYTKAK